MYKLSLLYVLLLSMLALPVYSQVCFHPGFIITSNHDTIVGKVDLRRDKLLSKVCRFKSVENGITSYQPGEIFGYGFVSGRFFESVKIEGKPKFVELLIKAEVSIYYAEDDYGLHYYFRRYDGNIVPLKYFEKIVTVNSNGTVNEGGKYIFIKDASSKNYGRAGEYLIKSQEFKDSMKYYFANEPDAIELINKLEKPNHNDLIQFAKDYHILSDDSISLIQYFKPEHKADYEFSIGHFNINHDRIPVEKRYIMYSFKHFKPLPHGRMSLGYGIQYARIALEKSVSKLYSTKLSQKHKDPIINTFDHYDILRIPLLVRYKYPGAYFNPYFAFGLNLYVFRDGHYYSLLQDFVPTYAIGFALKVYNNISITANIEGDLCWNADFNSSTTATFSQTRNIGILINW